MPLADITPLPAAPQRTDPPDTFNAKADAFVAALPGLVSQVNTLMSQLEVAAALIAAASAYADPGLLALTGKTPAADRLPYFDGAASSALAVFTPAGRALLAANSAAAQRSELGLGTAALAATGAFDPAGTGAAAAGAVAASLTSHTGATSGAHGMTAFGAALVALADAAAARGALGVWGIASYDLDDTGHILFTSGFLIQWGRANVAANGATAVTYVNPYSSWSKAWAGGVGEFITGQAPTQAAANTPTTTGFSIWTGSDNSFSSDWASIGV